MTRSRLADVGVSRNYPTENDNGEGSVKTTLSTRPRICVLAKKWIFKSFTRKGFVMIMKLLGNICMALLALFTFVPLVIFCYLSVIFRIGFIYLTLLNAKLSELIGNHEYVKFWIDVSKRGKVEVD